MKADIDLDIGRKTFASGLLSELIAVLRRSRPAIWSQCSVTNRALDLSWKRGAAPLEMHSLKQRVIVSDSRSLYCGLRRSGSGRRDHCVLRCTFAGLPENLRDIAVERRSGSKPTHLFSNRRNCFTRSRLRRPATVAFGLPI